jgi:hypothetical protein
MIFGQPHLTIVRYTIVLHSSIIWRSVVQTDVVRTNGFRTKFEQKALTTIPSWLTKTGVPSNSTNVMGTPSPPSYWSWKEIFESYMISISTIKVIVFYLCKLKIYVRCCLSTPHSWAINFFLIQNKQSKRASDIEQKPTGLKNLIGF